MAWDVTVPYTYASSHLADTATLAGAADDKAASNKEAKYRQLANSYVFVPVAIEWALYIIMYLFDNPKFLPCFYSIRFALTVQTNTNPSCVFNFLTLSIFTTTGKSNLAKKRNRCCKSTQH